MPDKITTSFEQKMDQLEALVARLESGELSLDAAMQSFEQGIKLTRECQSVLDQAEQKVQILLNHQGKESLTSLSVEE